MTGRDIALYDDEGEMAALVTISPITPAGDEIADEARAVLADAFDGKAE